MTTGKWWVVWSGKNVGVTHAARKPKGIAQGPFPSKIAAFRAGRRALLRYRVSGQGPNPPKRRRKNPSQSTPGREVALMVQRAGATGFWQFGDSIGIRTTVGADRKTFNVIKWYRLVNGQWEFAGSADGVRAGAVFVPLGKFLRTNPSKRLKLSGKMKTVKVPSPADNWAWYENDVGTHIDSAFGPDHVIRKMEGLLAATASGIREEDEALDKLQREAEELRGSETQEGNPEFVDEWLEDATKALQAHTADGLVWLWDGGDLLLVNAEQVLDNPSKKARQFISKKIRKLAHEGMAAPRRIGAAFNMARARGFKVPRANPPLRDFKSLAPHQAEITHGNLRIFYSYDTPVALIDSYYGAFRTTKKWSKTTARHLFRWLRENGYEPGRVEAVDQDVIDMAAMTGGIRYAKDEARARELDNSPRRSL